MSTITRDNMIIEVSTVKGFACRNNHGYRASAGKVHYGELQMVVGVVDPSLETVTKGFCGLPGETCAAKFLRTGKPVMYSFSPECGVTQGQRAGNVVPETQEVNCTKCIKGRVPCTK